MEPFGRVLTRAASQLSSARLGSPRASPSSATHGTSEEPFQASENEPNNSTLQEPQASARGTPMAAARTIKSKEHTQIEPKAKIKHELRPSASHASAQCQKHNAASSSTSHDDEERVQNGKPEPKVKAEDEEQPWWNANVHQEEPEDDAAKRLREANEMMADAQRIRAEAQEKEWQSRALLDNLELQNANLAAELLELQEDAANRAPSPAPATPAGPSSTSASDVGTAALLARLEASERMAAEFQENIIKKLAEISKPDKPSEAKTVDSLSRTELEALKGTLTANGAAAYCLRRLS